MTAVKFRQLIDMAIGSPEPGHVNFYALHCLLSCIAEKLDIIDEVVDLSKYNAITPCSASNHDISQVVGHGTRLGGGTAPEVATEIKLIDNAMDIEAQPEANTLADALETDKQVSTEKSTESAPEVSDKLQAVASREITQHLVQTEVSTTTVLSPRTSVRSISKVDKNLGSRSNLSFQNLDDRISKVELTIKKPTVSDGFFVGIAIMKDQLEMVMEQLLLLTYLTLSKKPDTQRVQQLLGLAQALCAIRNENVNIKSANRFVLPSIPSLDWQSTDVQLTEEVSEKNSLESSHSCSKRPSHYEQDGCLCYSTGRILNQLMELKEEFCSLAIEVNELSAKLVKQDRKHTLTLIQELQEQMLAVKLSITNAKEQQGRLEVRVANNTMNIANIKSCLEEVIAEKVDKAELDIILADKVDYNQLQRKVSLDQMLEVQCGIDKRFCEAFRQINENDKKIDTNVETLQRTLGFTAIQGVLDSFKQQVANEIRALHKLLQKYVDSTNDECAAAGGRVKVLQDLACISCDTACVMRTVEKSKVAKLPNARHSNSLSPLITYELSTIRKSGVMGYYWKDDFPHTPHAWLNQKGAGLPPKQVVPRHAAGTHTKTSARERVEKLLLGQK